LNEKKFIEAAFVCDSVLAKTPISLVANYYKGLALFSINQHDQLAAYYRYRYIKLCDAIVSSGNGFTCKTAFKTLFVPDEYELMFNYFQIENVKSQSLKFPCDQLKVTPSKLYTVNDMFFDTSESILNFQSKMKKNKD